MRKAGRFDFGNMEWQARNWGYNDATSRPTVEDVNALIAANMPAIRFTTKQHDEIFHSANYAYMMRLRHRYESASHIAAGFAQQSK